jgi:hypothetical protein
MSLKCKFADRSKPFFITVSVVEYVELFIRMNKMDYLLLTSESRPFGSVKLEKGTLALLPTEKGFGNLRLVHHDPLRRKRHACANHPLGASVPHWPHWRKRHACANQPFDKKANFYSRSLTQPLSMTLLAQASRLCQIPTPTPDR